ncbi:hypothetical protein HK100_012432 [Physocladia obscura]|uniref:Uncharacterized protein n=1 Tax=Physocladia obscura TaxID=109957 RepID=A0AAD5SZS7_9FUNG|nr:hypothetical protein HK100_012432 [Physocladia obscura]
MQSKNAAHIPAALVKKPQSAGDVDAAMKEMDEKHSTSFYSWIKSESNIGYVTTYKRSLFDSAMKQDPQTLVFVLQWLTAGWSVASTAEIFLKLFYSYRIESRKFAHLLAGVTSTWTQSQTEDIVNVLLIGENAVAAAQFMRYFTEGTGAVSRVKDAETASGVISLKKWKNADAVQLVRATALILRWNDVFIVIEIASLLFKEPFKKSTIIGSIYEMYENIDYVKPVFPISSSYKSASELTLTNDSDSDDSEASARLLTSEDEEIQRELAKILDKPKSRFRSQRESVSFAMEILTNILDESESEENFEDAAERLVNSLSLNNFASISNATTKNSLFNKESTSRF